MNTAKTLQKSTLNSSFHINLPLQSNTVCSMCAVMPLHTCFLKRGNNENTFLRPRSLLITLGDRLESRPRPTVSLVFIRKFAVGI